MDRTKYLWYIMIGYYFLPTDLYYGGEAVSADHPQSFVCPYCGKMGFTDATLQEHVTADHPDSSTEVVNFIERIQTKSLNT